MNFLTVAKLDTAVLTEAGGVASVTICLISDCAMDWAVTALWTEQSTSWFPAGAGVTFLQNVHSGSGANPASYSVCCVVVFPSSKVAGVWNWPLTSIQCQGEEWVELYHLPCHAFMAWTGTMFNLKQWFLTFYTCDLKVTYGVWPLSLPWNSSSQWYLL